MSTDGGFLFTSESVSEGPTVGLLRGLALNKKAAIVAGFPSSAATISARSAYQMRPVVISPKTYFPRNAGNPEPR